MMNDMLKEVTQIEKLESLEAPGWGSWLAGIGAGGLVGGGLVAAGIAIT